MKLFRYVKHDGVYPGMVDSSGQLRDISAHVDDVSRTCLSDTELARLCALDERQLPLISTPVRYLPPISDIGKFIAIGLNYLDHAEEAGLAIPSEPLVFFKPVSCISGADDPIVQPPHSKQLDWEVELGVVIGKRARYVPVAQALEHVAGYCVANDVSDRGFQFQSSQWDKGKSSDSFGPLGPWLVTRDEVPDPQNLPMWLEVNGQRPTGRKHPDHDLQRCRDYFLLQPLHDPRCWGCDHHRHPAWRVDGNEATSEMAGTGG